MVLPVDLNKVKNSANEISSKFSYDVKVNIFIDSSANENLIDFIKSLFKSNNIDCVHWWNIEDKTLTEKLEFENIDLALIIAGKSYQSFKMYLLLKQYEIKTAVVTLNPEYFINFCEEVNFPIGKKNIICPSFDLFEKKDCSQEIDFNKINNKMKSDITNKLSKWLVSNCVLFKYSLSYNFEFLRDKLAWSCVRASSLENALVGAIPIIPGPDMPAITLNQIKMILQIAAIYGNDISEDRILEIVVTAAFGIAFKNLSKYVKTNFKLTKFIVNPIFAYSWTTTLGSIAISYFKQGINCPNFLDMAKFGLNKLNN